MNNVADSLKQGWNDLAERAVTWLPQLLSFVIILVVGFIIARLVAKAVTLLLQRFNFDRLVERGGIAKIFKDASYTPSALLARIVYWAIGLITLTMAFAVFGANPISDVLKSVVEFIPKLLVGIIIFVIVSAIAAAARDLVRATLGNLSYGKTLGNIAYAAILFLGAVAALNQIGIAVTVTTSVLTAVLAALAGIAIVGVGGGLVKPMQARWERWLDTAEAETPKVKAEVAKANAETGAPTAVKAPVAKAAKATKAAAAKVTAKK